MGRGTERIQLFNIPDYFINTAKFSNLLHDSIVTKFEEEFAEYVGGKYAVGINSATSALFILCSLFKSRMRIEIPSIIPQVVPNAILQACRDFSFTDDVDWVGDSYVFGTFSGGRIIDSAHQVYRDQMYFHPSLDTFVYSFYPTKLVGSCDGGMIVSDDEGLIEEVRSLAYNGWNNLADKKVITPGFKMYMSSIQAYIARESLGRLDEKKEDLAAVREYYNTEFGLNNHSEHLYRIRVKNNVDFVKKAAEEGIICGIHYEAAHLNPVYQKRITLPRSELVSNQTVSLPYHEQLTLKEVQRVIKFVDENRGF